ncbi:N-acetylmuramoyl-L-alanine amidase [Neobacillus drentensis]|uniref:N-acetylmuramoyl-L-alanine amidase n=1 Tax=Neobacillus drentensis TaxID=220684 RepID=UPI001F481CD1|nr:N-acetylmuramoyl-L-alanine amidase [Neobacillus drentensis]ULT56759.1 N-acetylmuramoyl-L-alanine amidase [Neobacillus drentensis]
MRNKTFNVGIILLSLLLLVAIFFYVTLSAEKDNVLKANNKQEVKTVEVKKEVHQGKNDSVASLNEEGKASAPDNHEKAAQKNVVPDSTRASAVSDQLQEKKSVPREFLVVIDPGHQNRANTAPEPIGPGAKEEKMKVTGGTSGVTTGKPEYKLTLEASLILGQMLESRGVKVIYTRTTNDINMSNRERAEVANQNAADLFVRIHADGSTDRNVHGLSVLTPASNSPYTKAIFSDSLKASQFIMDETRKNSSVKVNGISYRGDMSGFNWSKVPCTLVELGFMTNPTEDKNLSDPIYLKSLLTNIADGILQYASYK